MLKKFLIGTFAALALMVASTAFASYDFGPTTLKVGSKGDYVKTLQTLVGASPVDGSFGPMTKAKVMAWQANNGLTADGLFGNLSKAKANLGLGGTSTNFPAGCTSAAGYSVTTGSPCNSVNANTFAPAGCTSASGFSPVTGGACYAAGSTTVVTGGAGDIQAVEVLSSVSGEKVGEGDVDHKVFAYTVEADNGSDLSINSVKLNLQRTSGTGSAKLNRYAGKVSVWMGSTKVGSAYVSDFSEASNVYSKSISLSGAIVKADKKETFYVSVDALANIDSTDLASNTWTVTLESTRFSDGTGAILTDSTGSILKTFQFASLATANDVELKVNLSSSNMTAKTVKVSTTSDTAQVELLRFTMKAQGSNMVIDQIPVNLTTSETDIDLVTSNVTLKIGGNTYNETVVTSSASAAITTLFDDLNLSVAKDATVEGVVYADLNDIETSDFDEGTTLSAAITSAIVTATNNNYIDVEDMNGDQLVTGDRTGSAQGETMTFRSTGVNTVMGTPTYSSTTNTNGLVTSVTYTIPVAVTSFGNTLYIGQSAQLATSASASNAFSLVVETAAAPTSESVSATTSITLATTDATIETNGFRLDDGVTKHFTINVTLTEAVTDSSIRVRLDQIQTFTTAGLVTGTASDLIPTTNYRTDYKYINN